MGDVGVGLDTIKSIIRSLSDNEEKQELTKVAAKCKKIIIKVLSILMTMHV